MGNLITSGKPTESWKAIDGSRPGEGGNTADFDNEYAEEVGNPVEVRYEGDCDVVGRA